MAVRSRPPPPHSPLHHKKWPKYRGRKSTGPNRGTAAVANKVKQAGSDITGGKATGHASELRQKAPGNASEADKARYMAGRASELSSEANEVGGEIKGKASEVGGEVKGKAQEVGGKVKGKTEELKQKAGASSGNPM